MTTTKGVTEFINTHAHISPYYLGYTHMWNYNNEDRMVYYHNGNTPNNCIDTNFAWSRAELVWSPNLWHNQHSRSNAAHIPSPGYQVDFNNCNILGYVWEGGREEGNINEMY